MANKSQVRSLVKQESVIYLEAAIKLLSPQEYAATTRAKRKGTKQGKQFVKQPKNIAKKSQGNIDNVTKLDSTCYRFAR